MGSFNENEPDTQIKIAALTLNFDQERKIITHFDGSSNVFEITLGFKDYFFSKDFHKPAYEY